MKKNNVSMNDTIEFELTEYGMKLFKNYYTLGYVFKDDKDITREEYIQNHIKIDKETGLQYMRMWKFMTVFGRDIYSGSKEIILNGEFTVLPKEKGDLLWEC